MSLSERLEHHLQASGLPYETRHHRYTSTALASARKAHVPEGQLAKSVLIHKEDGPVLAVLSADHQLDLHRLQDMLDRRLGLASESEVEEIFDDCSPGAIPPVGAAYNLRTIVDTGLSGRRKVWFEAGDHRTLIGMSGRDFDKLMQTAEHADICLH